MHDDHMSKNPKEDTEQTEPRPQSSMPRATFLRRVSIGAGALFGGAAPIGGLLSPVQALAASAPAAATISKIGLWLGNVKNVKANQALSYTDPKSGDPAVLIRLPSGQFVSYDAVCTHAGCTVPYDPTRKLLVCPCHGARFDPARGAAVVGGPAPQPLSPLPIHVDTAGNVYALDAKPVSGKPVSRLKAGPPPAAKGGDEQDEGRNKKKLHNNGGGDD